MDTDMIDQKNWEERGVCARVCHQEEPYQVYPGSGWITNGQLRLSVWTVLSYLTVKLLFRGMYKEIAAGLLVRMMNTGKRWSSL